MKNLLKSDKNVNDFLEEILDQTFALKNTLNYFQTEGFDLLVKLKKEIQLREIKYIIFTGMGSSLFCCYIPYYFLNSKGIICDLRDTSEFLYNSLPMETERDLYISFQNVLIFCVSQSGESGELVKLLKKLRNYQKPPLIVGLTNQPESSLFKFSDICFLMKAGYENGPTSKTYTCSILAVYLCLNYLFNGKHSIKSEIYEIESLFEEIQLFHKIFYETSNEIDKIISFLDKDVKFLEFIARGPSIATAKQAALNFKEIVKEKSEALSVGLFRHGCIEMLDEDFKIVILSSNLRDFELNSQLIKNLLKKWSVGKIFHITNQNFLRNENKRLYIFKHQVTNPYIAQIMEIVILQLIFYKLAIIKGLDPGKFKYTTKITKEG